MSEVVIKEALSKGIRYSDEVERNHPAMLNCVNRRPMRHGDTAYEAVVRPFASTPTDGFIPEVVLIRNSAGTWLLGEGLYPLTLDKTNGYTEGTVVTIYDKDGLTTLTNLPGTGRWHTAIFYKGWMAFRDGCIVWTNDGTNFRYHTAGPLTGCQMRGRMFYGGLASFFTEFEKYDYFEAWISGFTIYTPGTSVPMEAFKNDMVYMCSVNGHDIRWFLYPYLCIDAGMSFQDDYEAGIDNTDWSLAGTWITAAPPAGYDAKVSGTGESLGVTLAGTANASLTIGNYYRMQVYVTVASGSLIRSGLIGLEDFLGPGTITATGVYVYHFRYAKDSTSFAFRFTPNPSFTGTISVRLWRMGEINEEEIELGARRSIFMELASVNDSGFYHMDWPGSIYKMLPLEKHALIYGSGGVSALSMTGGTIMSKSDILKCGIASRDAAGGDLKSHVFVTTEGEIVRIGDDLKPVVLGGRELFILDEDQTQNEIYVSHDERWGDFYISDMVNDRAFLVTETGISEIYQHVFQIADLGKQGGTVDGLVSDRVGIAEALSATTARWTTDVIDLNSTGRKFIKGVRIVGDFAPTGVVPLTVNVYVRNFGSTAFHDPLGDRTPSLNGYFPVGHSASELYLDISSTTKDVRLHSVILLLSDVPGRVAQNYTYKVS